MKHPPTSGLAIGGNSPRHASEGTPILVSQLPPGNQDALLREGGRNVELERRDRELHETEDHIDSAQLAARLLALSAAPFALLLLMFLVVVLFYHGWPFWVFVTFILSTLKSLMIGRFFKKRWQRFVGPHLVIGGCCGLMLGLYMYYNYLVLYFSYETLGKHTNVAARIDPLNVADSGMLSFANDTRVDFTRAVGYQSASANAKLCVAPIIDSSMLLNDSISFFAAGVGCCEWRGLFRCGDALDVDARGGVLHLDMANLLSPVISWAVEDWGLRQGFEAAVRMDEAVYGLIANKNARLLHWVHSPIGVKNKYRTDAIWSSVRWLLFFAAALTAAGVAAAAGRRKLSKVLRKGKLAVGQHGKGDEVAHRRGQRPGKMRKLDYFLHSV